MDPLNLSSKRRPQFAVVVDQIFYDLIQPLYVGEFLRWLGRINSRNVCCLLYTSEPYVSDGDAELMWESATGNGKSYLRIKGKLPEHRLGKPVALRIESDSGNKIREMEILSASGISAAGCQIDVVKDDTWPLYVGFSLALIAAMAFLLAGSFGVKKKRKKFRCV